jgi:hypothetical protein
MKDWMGVVVAYLGAVQHVVPVVVVLHQLAEGVDPLSRRSLVHRPHLAAA